MAVLLSACALFVIMKIECSMQAVFHRETQKYLANHVIETKQTATELECGLQCVAKLGSCVSVNYKISGIGKGRCELNDKALSGETSDANEELNPEFNHLYIIEKGDLNTISQELSKGVKGVTKENPGKSCRDVLDSVTSELLENVKSGLYWIQPDGDSFPIQSYCDMTFQDGGWTLASYGYVATTGYGQQNTGNKNIPNMNHPNGYAWHPNKRNSSQGVVALEHGAVNLARGAKYMIMAAGSNPVTGGINQYSYVYFIDISNNPYKITFANHNCYHNGSMHVVEFTVKALKGETGSGNRYALGEALGVSWGDSYPAGYGFSPSINAKCTSWSKGPFFPSVHSGDRGAGGCFKPKSYTPDVAKGCPSYAHYGWHSLYTTRKSGQTSIWFK